MSLNFSNLNSLWASVLVETLARLGLRSAIVCPGSRSTPITVALARHPDIETIPILDERSGAFWALGLAKASGLPIVLVCTSGTAGANFLPAVIEAQQSAVPLIILTGDRPPELRQCHSGQTIDQIKLFGDFAQFFSEMATPIATVEMLRYARQTVAQAWRQSQQPQKGVVHLNCPFRDPLPPNIVGESVDFLRDHIDPRLFFRAVNPIVQPQKVLDSTPLLEQCFQTKRGIIIAGVDHPENAEEYCRAITKLSAHLGYPVLAEALSPLRNFVATDFKLITTYDFILRDSRRAEGLTPEIVIQIGALPTSKVLRAWLMEAQSDTWVLSPCSDNFDPLHRPTTHLNVTVESLSTNLPAKKVGESTEYFTVWQQAQGQTAAAIANKFKQEKTFIEGKIAWLLSRYLPAKSGIIFANSMTVRYAEFFWQQNQRQIQPFFNRGANGIDGTLSTAIAIAHKHPEPCVLLTGDLALLHDTNGFLTVPQFQGSLTIVVVNNNGGGIFEMLPIASVEDVFEDFFATPQTPEIKQLCLAYGVSHKSILTEAEFITEISDLPSQGVQVLEIKCDRRRDTQWLKAMYAEFSQPFP